MTNENLIYQINRWVKSPSLFLNQARISHILEEGRLVDDRYQKLNEKARALLDHSIEMLDVTMRTTLANKEHLSMTFDTEDCVLAVKALFNYYGTEFVSKNIIEPPPISRPKTNRIRKDTKSSYKKLRLVRKT